MEKNIIVVDEQGNDYDPTYPKRAKGLVKNGRARFVSEKKICLVCPPNRTLEDLSMVKEKNIIGDDCVDNYEKQIVQLVESEEVNTDGKLSMNYVLEQIEKIAKQTEYLNQVISELRQMETGGAGDIGNTNKAEALLSVVKCRETTNQQLLGIYEKMYDDLKSYSQTEGIQDILMSVEKLPPQESKEVLLKIYNDRRSNTISRFDEITNWIKTLNKDEFDPSAWDVIMQSVQTQIIGNY